MNNQTPDITGLVERVADLGLANLAQDVGQALQSSHTTGYTQGLRDAAEKAEAYEPLGYMSDREREYCRDHGVEISTAILSLIPKESDHG
ncbi:hypothetical protein [Sphingomonas sp.]|uniref:hypothetical protein n=1 Tax=Sphingomonas sp. TaxID=28214 RepID=UPI002FD9C050